MAKSKRNWAPLTRSRPCWASTRMAWELEEEEAVWSTSWVSALKSLEEVVFTYSREGNTSDCLRGNPRDPPPIYTKRWAVHGPPDHKGKPPPLTHMTHRSHLLQDPIGCYSCYLSYLCLLSNLHLRGYCDWSERWSILSHCGADDSLEASPPISVGTRMPIGCYS